MPDDAASTGVGIADHGVRADVVDPPTELIELRDALARLSERQRIAIVLRYFLDLPDAEIAQVLGAREATVRSLVRRVLRVLAKELA